jgi:hypothetical protein
MSDYGTKLAEGFSQKVVSLFFDTSISTLITNQDYEGEIKDKLSKLNILTFAAIDWVVYNGSDLSPVSAQESAAVLTTDQLKAFYFKIPSLNKFYVFYVFGYLHKYKGIKKDRKSITVF